MGVQRKNVPLVTAALEAKGLTAANLRAALAVAKREPNPEILPLIEKKIASMPAEAVAPAVTISPDVLKSYAATYRNDNATMVVTLKGDQLLIQPQGAPQAFAAAPDVRDGIHDRRSAGRHVRLRGPRRIDRAPHRDAGERPGAIVSARDRRRPRRAPRTLRTLRTPPHPPHPPHPRVSSPGPRRGQRRAPGQDSVAITPPGTAMARAR